MPTLSRAVHAGLCLAAVVALTQPSVAAVAGPTHADASAATTSTSMASGASGTSGAAGGPGSTHPGEPVHAVSYHGVRLDVPASWPVVDLRATPTACVRMDKPVVYLGDPTGQQDCPAHLVGRTTTVWLHDAAPLRGPVAAARPAKVGALAAQELADPLGHGIRVRLTHQSVQVDASWGTDSRPVDAALSTVTATSAGASPSSSSSSAQPTGSTAPAATATRYATTPHLSSVAFTAATPAASSTFTGMAFDTCAAPSTSTMSSWLSSPYRTLGIYIGGSMRACGDGNLSSSWVSSVASMGWGLAPIYVGPQAPCVNQSGLATFTASSAVAEAKADADDAVSRAAAFGMGAGTPIYYDMEAYNTSVAGCSATVMSFISAWSSELAARGYSSGAYGSTSSLMTDMSRAVGTSGFVPPNNVWFADWNGLQTASDSYFPNAYWVNHQRLHQYSGGVNETWGGVPLNIDADWSDAQVAGAAVPVSYGTNVVGPGSAGFAFTGQMGFWRPNAPQGVKGMAYWTYSNGTKEYNGATWTPQLSPGLYNVQAFIPDTAATAMAPYTVRYAGGSTVATVNQQVISGYTSLGTFASTASTPISVHVGDNDGTSTTTQLGIDAMAFQLVASAPGAPTGVAATAGDSQATVTWGAAPANGSAVTSYTVTASPGGATVTVPGTATSTTFTGLGNGTAYSFTVTATNAVGPGPGATSSSVTPHSATAPAHDWNGDGHNDVVARDGGGNLLLYPGDGAGGWLPRQQVGTYWNGMTALVAVGDFNGDGHPDLMARDSGGNLWLYPGDGAGGWLPRQQIGTYWNGMTALVGVGDFNGDGHPDLMARDSGGTLWLYPGDGAGGWLPRQQIGTYWNGMTALVGVGDFNGDGHPDLMARDGGGNLWLYPGDGAGGWLPRQQIGSGWNGMTAIS